MAKKADNTDGLDLNLDLDNIEFDEADMKAAADSATQKEGTYSLDNLPKDFRADATEKKVYDPLPADVYQVEVLNIEIKDNIFFKADDPKENPMNRYTTQVTFVVIEDGANYGRQLWDNFAPVIKPSTKKGPTKAYKFVTTMLGTSMDWDACESFASKFGENMKGFIGKQLRVTTEVVSKQDGTPKNKVASYMAPKGTLPKFDKSKLDSKK